MFYHNCGNSFTCGSITGVGYPFRGYEEPEYCGYPGLVLSCKNNIPTILIVNVEYRVMDIDQTTQTMRISREDMMGDVCKLDVVNTTLDNSPFKFTSSYTNLNCMYGCNISGNDRAFLFPGTGLPNLGCEFKITVPVGTGRWIYRSWDKLSRKGLRSDGRWVVKKQGMQGLYLVRV